MRYPRSLEVEPATALRAADRSGALAASVRAAASTDAGLAALVSAVYFVAAAWPLLFLHVLPYQDMPDHLATVCVLLHPERYPEYVSNGWLKADSLFILGVYLLAKAFGPLAAGRIFTAIVLAGTAWTLPRFVLAFTDRRRFAVATLVMLPMVHNWWVLMGMLNFAAALPIGLELVVRMARQFERPTPRRAAILAAMAIVLWYAHAVVLLLVAVLTLIEALRRPTWRDRFGVMAPTLGPLAPVVALALVTAGVHALRSMYSVRYGAVFPVGFLDTGGAVAEAWMHWMLGISPLTAWTLLPSLALVVWAARRVRDPIPMFSGWALLALGGLYLLLPCTMPGFGYVNERVLPLLWMWALVRVPPAIEPKVRKWLIASSVLYAVSLPVELFAAEHVMDRFTAAAPLLRPGARVLTLNLPPDISILNTTPLFHASGMFTVLREAHPQDVWADSPSMPIRRARPPAFVEDPVLVREFAARAKNVKTYCKVLREGMRPADDCVRGWRSEWSAFWRAARDRYDYVVIWNETDDLMEAADGAYRPILASGKLRVFGRETGAP